MSEDPAHIGYTTDLYKLIEEDDKLLSSVAEQVCLHEWSGNDVESLQHAIGHRHAPGVLTCQRVYMEKNRVHKALETPKESAQATSTISSRTRTLLALRCVTTTAWGASPSPTVRVVNIFTGTTCPPTSAAQPRPKTRLQSTAPSAESSPYTFPCAVAATITLRKPNASRASGSDAFAAGATDDEADAYEPVTKRRTKFTAYCGKFCPYTGVSRRAEA